MGDLGACGPMSVAVPSEVQQRDRASAFAEAP